MNNMRVIKHIACFIILPSLTLSAYSINSSLTKQQALSHLDQEIISVKITLKKDYSQYNHLINKLKQTELTIAESHKDVYEQNKVIIHHTHNLQRLKQQQQHLTQEQKQLQVRINQLVNLIYPLQNQSLFKYMLQKNKSTQHRESLQYLDYLASNLTQLKKRNLDLQHMIQASLNAMSTETKTVLIGHEQQDKSIKSLNKLHQSRKTILIQLKQNIIAKEHQLITLKENKQHLEDLILTLNQHQKQGLPNQKIFNFSSHKGQLIWPVSGTLNTTTKTKRLLDRSVTLLTHTNKTVYAIAPGKVVFAHWIPHYGLTLIIQHDHSYLSLYAHINMLYKKLGDSVHLGEEIAVSGKSGGKNRNQLYFALRHGSIPINPKAWCLHRST
jgi:murein hydrolase activator